MTVLCNTAFAPALYAGSKTEILRQDVFDRGIFERVNIHAQQRRSVNMHGHGWAVLRLQIRDLMDQRCFLDPRFADFVVGGAERLDHAVRSLYKKRLGELALENLHPSQ